MNASIPFKFLFFYNSCSYIDSISHQLLTRLLPVVISPEQSITLTEALHCNFHLSYLCSNTYQITHTELVET